MRALRRSTFARLWHGSFRPGHTANGPKAPLKLHPPGLQRCTAANGEPVSLHDVLKEVANEQGLRVVVAENDETWDDAMEEFDDPWMRQPAAAETSGMGLLNLSTPLPELPSAYEADSIQNITTSQLKQLLDSESNVLLLDVREGHEFAAGHIQDCINIPLPKLDAETADKLHGHLVVVVGSSDHRARQACVRLTRVFNMPQVLYYDGSWVTWRLSSSH